LRDARLPRMKTLEEFDFSQSPKISATELRQLAEGGYIERAEPILFIGDCGTGKTHLMTGLCVAACRQKRRVRFTTTAGLVNDRTLWRKGAIPIASGGPWKNGKRRSEGLCRRVSVGLRLALRPKRSALRASQGFAPAGA